MRHYYILINNKRVILQLINGWHEWSSEEWHLFSMYKKYGWHGYDYYLGLLGFRLRLMIKKDNN